MQKLLLILIIFAAYFAVPEKGLACSCLLRVTPAGKSDAEIRRLRDKEIKNHLQKTDAVFLGKVVSSTLKPASADDSPSYFEVKIKLERTWKGTDGDEITVFTPDNSCFGYSFSVGETYLVYAGKVKQDSSQLWAFGCGGTLSSELMNDDLKVLGKGKKVKSK